MGEPETTFLIGHLGDSDKGDPGLILGETVVEGKKSYRQGVITKSGKTELKQGLGGVSNPGSGNTSGKKSGVS